MLLKRCKRASVADRNSSEVLVHGVYLYHVSVPGSEEDAPRTPSICLKKQALNRTYPANSAICDAEVAWRDADELLCELADI